jgi:DNA adenine methylase
MKNKNPSFQPIIKWSGSKRKIAYNIKDLIPQDIGTYYDPFVGGGSILYVMDTKKKIASDINRPLIDLWKIIRDNPEYLIEKYTIYWKKLNDKDNPNNYNFFYQKRNDFNIHRKPEDLLFLSRVCVNGLIRFNRKGEFNNSLHYTRKGIDPKKFSYTILQWSNKIKETEFFHCSYIEILDMVKKNDFIYLDPPYFNTKGMYYGKIDFDEFLDFLYILNRKGIKYLLSFDGKTTNKDYTANIPSELYKQHKYLYSGKSTFRKVIDKVSNEVYESIYMNY